MDAALMFFFVLWSFLGGKGSSPSTPHAHRRAPHAPPQLPPAGTVTSVPAWPQVVPSNLPAFPGNGWEFDEPPPKAVQQRASALLSSLWARGSGAFQTEQTASRWITYRAEIVASGKKGVVAYRLKQAAAAPAPRRVPAARATRTAPVIPPHPAAPAAAPSSAPAPAPAMPTQVVVPASAQAPAATPSVIDQNGYASASMMPDLFEGMGTKAKPDGNVKVAQHWLNRHLGNRLVEDGVFGRNTRLAAIDFQKRSGLAPKDGTQAQLLARGYGAIKKATWEKLLTEPGVAV